MRDLTSASTFTKDMYNLKLYNKRVITSNEVNEKNKEIDDWIKEQQEDKTAVTLGVEDYQDPQALQQQQSFDDIQQSFGASQMDDYNALVEHIRKSLKQNRKKAPQSSSGFGMNNNFNSMMDNNQLEEYVNPLTYWMKFATWGRDLNTFEDKDLEKDDNNQNDNGFGFMSNSTPKDTETKEDKFDRLNIEDWKSYLFAGKIGSISLLSSLGMSALDIHPLWANPFIIAGVTAASLSFILYKLTTKFQDGPLKGNYTFSELGIQNYLNNKEKQKQQNNQQEKTTSNDTIASGNDFGSGSIFDNGFDDDDNDDFFSDDGEENDDEDEDITEEITGEMIDVPASETSFPKALGSSANKEELFHVEEQFLQYCYDQRGKVELNRPIDILKFFAPIIVSYNKDFASSKIIDRKTWLFKNIAFVLGNYYNQLDTKFAKYSEHSKEYYYVVDNIIETALFYKVNFTLPVSIAPDKFKSNISKLINILKSGPTDKAVDVIVEMAGKSGTVKIMRLNKKGFMPVVSTGDVLRFKGMKTTNGNNLIEELSKPGDLPILFGLKNAENAFVFDIASNQNTNMAVAGFTGSGKTVTTTSWLVNILVSHSPDEVGFIVLDPKKGSAWQAFRYAPHVLGYFATEDMKKWPAITEMLREIEAARQDYMNNTIRYENYYEARKLFASEEQWDKLMKVPRLIVIYDEMIDTLSTLNNIDSKIKVMNKGKKRDEQDFGAYKDTFMTSLGGLANVTREGGMTLMALSQRTDNNSLPRTYLSSSSIQFGMRLKFKADAVRLFAIDEKDVPSNITDLPTGTGYLAANGVELSQLSTPLFSGDPQLNNEVTKIVGIAWTILYSYNHNEEQMPQGYFFNKAKTPSEYGLPSFSLFNRDQMFKREKKELLNGDVHYANVPTNLSFDLDDKPGNENINDIIEDIDANNKSDDVELTDEERGINVEKVDKVLDSEDKDIEEQTDVKNSLDSNDNTNNNVNNNVNNMQSKSSIFAQDNKIKRPTPGMIVNNNDDNNINNDNANDENHKPKSSVLGNNITRPQPTRTQIYSNLHNDNDNDVSNTGITLNDLLNNQTTNQDSQMTNQTYIDVEDYFINNNINSIDGKVLDSQFNANVIRAAISRNIIKKMNDDSYTFIGG